VKLENYLNGKMKLEGKLFNNTDYALTYTVCYNMCTPRTPYNWSEDLYTKHGETIEEYLKDHVLGALKEKSVSLDGGVRHSDLRLEIRCITHSIGANSYRPPPPPPLSPRTLSS